MLLTVERNKSKASESASLMQRIEADVLPSKQKNLNVKSCLPPAYWLQLKVSLTASAQNGVVFAIAIYLQNSDAAPKEVVEKEVWMSMYLIHFDATR